MPDHSWCARKFRATRPLLLLVLVSVVHAVATDAFAAPAAERNTASDRSARSPRGASKPEAAADAKTRGVFFRGRRRKPPVPGVLLFAAAGTDAKTGEEEAPTASAGLYKKYADHAVERLLETGWLVEDASVPEDLSTKQAAARGSKTGSVVKITTRALVPSNNHNGTNVVRYARITLLETVPSVSPPSESGAGTPVVSTDGIQVLNFVVLPSADTTLPVLGIDMVSLPGSKHLLLLDAQPMAAPNPHEGHWEGWYENHVKKNNDDDDEQEEAPPRYAWGGDFPDAVKKYVSKHALWTRLQNLPEQHGDASAAGGSTPALDAIQGDIFDAYRAHLGVYLDLLGSCAGNIEAVEGDNHQPSYLEYRRNNDPAKPMLNALYGAEWTQSLLDNVLFPKD